MSHNCLIDPNTFCYVCGELIDSCQRRQFTPIVRKAYEMYFGCKVENLKDPWLPHNCCANCSSQLLNWLNGKCLYMPFTTPMKWRKPKDHETDCYFCWTGFTNLSDKDRNDIDYPNQTSSSRPVPHDNKPVIVLPKKAQQLRRAELESQPSVKPEPEAAAYIQSQLSTIKVLAQLAETQFQPSVQLQPESSTFTQSQLSIEIQAQVAETQPQPSVQLHPESSSFTQSQLSIEIQAQLTDTQSDPSTEPQSQVSVEPQSQVSVEPQANLLVQQLRQGTEELQQFVFNIGDRVSLNEATEMVVKLSQTEWTELIRNLELTHTQVRILSQKLKERNLLDKRARNILGKRKPSHK